jgi:hypothetical protein
MNGGLGRPRTTRTGVAKEQRRTHENGNYCDFLGHACGLRSYYGWGASCSRTRASSSSSGQHTCRHDFNHYHYGCHAHLDAGCYVNVNASVDSHDHAYGSPGNPGAHDQTLNGIARSHAWACSHDCTARHGTRSFGDHDARSRAVDQAHDGESGSDDWSSAHLAGSGNRAHGIACSDDWTRAHYASAFEEVARKIAIPSPG